MGPWRLRDSPACAGDGGRLVWARRCALPQPRIDAIGPLRIVLVDDHPAVIGGVAAAIAATDDLEVAATASTLDDALAVLASGVPEVDVVVADIQLAGAAEGLRLLERAEAAPADRRRPAVLILSGFDMPSLVRASFERGAAGYLSKSADTDEILAAIRIVAAGGTVFSADQVRSVRSAPRRPSDREIQVIGLVAAGASNGEVAAILGLSEKTVESHLRRLFDRYAVLSRTELVVLAIREGWVSEGDAGR